MEGTTLEQVLGRARDLGFLGPGAVERHVQHADGLLGILGTFDRFLDLGSGAGVPGLVLALRRPDVTGVLLDAGTRRCEFLDSAVVALGLDERVSVVCGRAEELARDPALRGRFPLVVARGFGPPAVAAECGVGFVAPAGRLVVTEPPPRDDAHVKERWSPEGLAKLGFGAPRPLRSGEVGAVELVLGGQVEEQWPRRSGVPTKRPLWGTAPDAPRGSTVPRGTP